MYGWDIPYNFESGQTKDQLILTYNKAVIVN